jgi:hypothetical protein
LRDARRRIHVKMWQRKPGACRGGSFQIGQTSGTTGKMQFHFQLLPAAESVAECRGTFEQC